MSVAHANFMIRTKQKVPAGTAEQKARPMRSRSLTIEHGVSRMFDAAALQAKNTCGQPTYHWSNDLTPVNSM